jgi:hypothetical protein
MVRKRKAIFHHDCQLVSTLQVTYVIPESHLVPQLNPL